MRKVNIFKERIKGVMVYAGPFEQVERYLELLGVRAYLVDLREYIEDFSDDINEYIDALSRIMYAINEGERTIGYGCQGGCGRTGTITVMLAGWLTRNFKTTKEIYETFEGVRGCGIETPWQRLIAASWVSLTVRNPSASFEQVAAEARKLYEEARNGSLSDQHAVLVALNSLFPD